MNFEPSQQSNRYIKFQNHGDTYTGHFVKYDPTTVSFDKVRPTLFMKSPEGVEQEISCTADLAKRIEAARPYLKEGTELVITYVSDMKITGKPQPMKVYTVVAPNLSGQAPNSQAQNRPMPPARDPQQSAHNPPPRQAPPQHRQTQAKPAQTAIVDMFDDGYDANEAEADVYQAQHDE
jgi:hypothetical protein